MGWVTPDDVRARWPGVPVDDVVVQAWVDDAETILRVEFPWLTDATVGGDPELAAVVVLVVARMVIRALSAPIGLRQETVGDTSLAYTDRESLYLSDGDHALVAGFGPQVAFVVSTMPVNDGLPRSWRWWWARGWDDESSYWRWVA